MVVVWFALMLIVLLGFAGFAVDMSNWWFQAERLQRAADAGAHAGVVFLPADVAGATTTARAEAAKNGYTTTGAGANATITVTQEPNPNRLRVKITTEVPTYFVGLLGVDSVELNREAVAEYVSPVPMGSPENRLGNDPEIGYNPQLWSMVGGPQSYKHWGDRYQAKRCALNSTYFESLCTSSRNPQNDDYATDGYLYALEVKQKVAGQPLRIQIYDPAFVDTGSTCSTVAMSAHADRPAAHLEQHPLRRRRHAVPSHRESVLQRRHRPRGCQHQHLVRGAGAGQHRVERHGQPCHQHRHLQATVVQAVQPFERHCDLQLVADRCRRVRGRQRGARGASPRSSTAG